MFEKEIKDGDNLANCLLWLRDKVSDKSIKTKDDIDKLLRNEQKYIEYENMFDFMEIDGRGYAVLKSHNLKVNALYAGSALRIIRSAKKGGIKNMEIEIKQSDFNAVLIEGFSFYGKYGNTFHVENNKLITGIDGLIVNISEERNHRSTISINSRREMEMEREMMMHDDSYMMDDNDYGIDYGIDIATLVIRNSTCFKEIEIGINPNRKTKIAFLELSKSNFEKMTINLDCGSKESLDIGALSFYGNELFNSSPYENMSFYKQLKVFFQVKKDIIGERQAYAEELKYYSKTLEPFTTDKIILSVSGLLSNHRTNVWRPIILLFITVIMLWCFNKVELLFPGYLLQSDILSDDGCTKLCLLRDLAIHTFVLVLYYELIVTSRSFAK